MPSIRSCMQSPAPLGCTEVVGRQAWKRRAQAAVPKALGEAGPSVLPACIKKPRAAPRASTGNDVMCTVIVSATWQRPGISSGRCRTGSCQLAGRTPQKKSWAMAAATPMPNSAGAGAGGSSS